MMKAIVGIDVEGTYGPALHLLARLGFSNPTVELVHVEEVLPIGGAGVAPFSYMNSKTVDLLRKETGEQLLNEARDRASAAGLNATTLYCLGNVCENLMERADDTEASVIAIGSTRKSRYGAFFLGGVGRGLAIGAHQSVLITKNDVQDSGGLTAVFATDGSTYADDCLRMLVGMQPKGIRRLSIVSAVDKLRDGDPYKSLRAHLNSLVSHVCDEGIKADSQIIEGTPAEVIDLVMDAIDADMLILGAQGHGLVERLFVGSFSLQEVVASKHSILLLRK